MTIRHDPLLARALAGEITARWQGRRTAALVLDRERRAAELRFRDAAPLWFLLHPEAGFVLPGDAAAGEEADAAAAGRLAGSAQTFRRLYLGAAEAPPDERRLHLSLVDRGGRERHRIAVELHGNQWNLLLLDASPDAFRIRTVLWPRRAGGRTLRAGEDYAPPRGDRRGADAPLSREAWSALLRDAPPERRRGATLRAVAWLSAVNVDWVLGEAALEPGSDDTAAAGDVEALGRAHERYLAVCEAARSLAGGADPVPCRLLEMPRGLQPYPLPLGQPDAAAVPSTLAAMREAAQAARARDRYVAPGGVAAGAVQAARAEEAGRLRDALLARREEAERRRAALRRELEEGESAEALRAVGNLLLARLREVERGASQVVLRDFDGSEREVALDPRRDPAENAAAYFERAAKRERAAARVPAELERVEARLGAVSAALGRLEEEGPSEALWEAAGGRPAADEAGRGEEERLPYLRFRTSGGLEVRVGRSARANDDLTFHHASPDDIWMHARQTKGAHVVLRWDRREENPPRRDLLEAAVAAAVHSGARHSGTVPVDWTRRRYVRKPRKAPPGAVLPDRVSTLFVEPDEKVLEAMKRNLED